MEWLPIETAPKDGTPIMVWGYYSELLGGAPTADNVNWGVATMRWADTTFSKYESVGDGLYRKLEEKDGYLQNVSSGFGGLRPIRWAPLPDGPRAIEKQPRGALVA